MTNPQARAGLETLAKFLSRGGVRAVVAYWPPAVEIRENAERKAKNQGLDDWLVADRLRAIQSLPARAFAAEIACDGITDTFDAQMIAKQFGEELAFSRSVGLTGTVQSGRSTRAATGQLAIRIEPTSSPLRSDSSRTGHRQTS